MLWLILLFAVVHVLADCESQYSVTHNITTFESTIMGSLEHLDPPGFYTILALTKNGFLWRSTDDGKSWNTISLSGSISLLFVAPSRKVAMGCGKEGDIWVTSDSGSSWKHFKTPKPIVGAKWHAGKEEWVLAKLRACTQAGVCSDDLYLSQDYGQNWSLLASNVLDYAWQSLASLKDYKGILVYQQTFNSANITTKEVVVSDSFFRSTSSSPKGFKVIATNVLGFLATRDIILMAQGDRLRGLSLIASYDGGITLHDIRFPGTLLELSYTILDLGVNTSFVSVRHDDNWGNIYVGNNLANEFSLSLQYAVHESMVDFWKISAIPGTYVANAYPSEPDPVHASPWNTLITYDVGGEWSKLSAPPELCLATPDNCHINFGHRHSRMSVLSPPQAAGHILGAGTVGPKRDNSVISVFFSRDAGSTWQKILDGKYIYRIANRGGLLFFFPLEDTILTSRDVRFSFDEGLSLNTCSLNIDPTFTLEDIVSEPNIQSTSLLIKGHTTFKNNNNDQIQKSSLIYVDFADVSERECTGFNQPDQEGSDYESWFPSDARNAGCINGAKLKYIRRKQSTPCRYPRSETLEELDRYTQVHSCPCVIEDYECDYCFKRSEDQTTCVIDPECADFVPNVPPTLCTGYWQQTQGYRKIPGNKCSGGIDIDVKLVPCPASNSKIGIITFLFCFVMILTVVVAILVLRQLTATNERLRNFALRFVPEHFLPYFEAGVYGAQGIYDGSDGSGSSTSVSDSYSY